MNTFSIHYHLGNRASAVELAELMDMTACPIDIHEFPDRESRVTVTPCSGTAVIFASLDDPDRKLVHLALAASALRANGADRLVLIAPYLCYMRQDKAFRPGEAVSQQVIGAFLSEYFDRIITVDPHLHRISNLDEILTNTQGECLTASGPIATALHKIGNLEDCVLIGPDSESRQWVSAIAAEAGLPFIIAKKTRVGDRTVELSLPGDPDIHGKTAILVDDIVSSGTTLVECTLRLREAGVRSIDVVAVHMLASEADLVKVYKSGVASILSTDTIHHATNAISLATLYADALEVET